MKTKEKELKLEKLFKEMQEDVNEKSRLPNSYLERIKEIFFENK